MEASKAPPPVDREALQQLVVLRQQLQAVEARREQEAAQVRLQPGVEERAARKVLVPWWMGCERCVMDDCWCCFAPATGTSRAGCDANQDQQLAGGKCEAAGGWQDEQPRPEGAHSCLRTAQPLITTTG